MTDTEVHFVSVQISAPGRNYPAGLVADGAYIVTDNTVTLTDRQGNPVRDQHGKAYTKKIANGDSAKTIAARMTKDLRTNLRGKDGRVSGFDRPLVYPKFGVA